MSSTAYPHEHDDCDSCRAFDADLLVDVLDQDGVPGQNSRWCKRCAGPLLARLVLQGSTAVVAALNAPLPRRESVASEVRRRHVLTGNNSQAHNPMIPAPGCQTGSFGTTDPRRHPARPTPILSAHYARTPGRTHMLSNERLCR
jgi:hypothetical protein